MGFRWRPSKRGLPTVFGARQAAEAGGLISYGSDLPGVYRGMGGCAARILKGESLAEMPVLEPTTFDFVINFGGQRARSDGGTLTLSDFAVLMIE